LINHLSLHTQGIEKKQFTPEGVCNLSTPSGLSLSFNFLQSDVSSMQVMTMGYQIETARARILDEKKATTRR